MDFTVNSEELEALCGLPHAQQLAYLRGIRPYMDVKTGLVGIKRRISYQSISEQLYVEPHQGIKSQDFSRAQARRALSALERVGLISLQSEEKQLILKCNLATLGYFVQNKVVTNPSQQAVTNPHVKSPVNTGLSRVEAVKADTPETPKAATPLKEDNYYIYLLSHFEKFWLLYPEKKSRERALEAFKHINPDEHLLRTLLQALDQQIKARRAKEVAGEWVPPWKYPANWLAQKCWEDEIKIEVKQENRNAKHRTHTQAPATDPFWNPEAEDTTNDGEGECKLNQPGNVIQLQSYR
jgi:hypothetical protein